MNIPLITIWLLLQLAMPGRAYHQNDPFLGHTAIIAMAGQETVPVAGQAAESLEDEDSCLEWGRGEALIFHPEPLFFIHILSHPGKLGRGIFQPPE